MPVTPLYGQFAAAHDRSRWDDGNDSFVLRPESKAMRPSSPAQRPRPAASQEGRGLPRGFSPFSSGDPGPGKPVRAGVDIGDRESQIDAAERFRERIRGDRRPDRPGIPTSTGIPVGQRHEETTTKPVVMSRHGGAIQAMVEQAFWDARERLRRQRQDDATHAALGRRGPSRVMPNR